MTSKIQTYLILKNCCVCSSFCLILLINFFASASSQPTGKFEDFNMVFSTHCKNNFGPDAFPYWKGLDKANFYCGLRKAQPIKIDMKKYALQKSKKNSKSSIKDYVALRAKAIKDQKVLGLPTCNKGFEIVDVEIDLPMTYITWNCIKRAYIGAHPVNRGKPNK